MRSLLMLVGFLGVLSSAFAQSEDARIAEKFIPEGWRELNPHARTEREFAVSPLCLDGSGKCAYLVAVYSSGSEKMVRVIKKSPAGNLLANSARIPEVTGFGAQVRTHDFDRDGKEEIIVLYPDRQKLWSTVYRWDGLRLVAVDSREDVEFRDLDGDGTQELVETATRERIALAQEEARQRAQESDPEPELAESGEAHEAVGKPIVVPNRVYRYRGGQFVPGESEYFLARVARGAGEPAERAGSFEVNSRSGRYFLQIVNGDDKGSARVEKGEVWLNGIKVVKPEQFVAGKSRLIQFPVTLQLRNELKIRIHSPETARMAVSVIEK